MRCLMRTGAGRLLPGLPAVVLLLAAGCATYVASNLELRSQLATSDWQAALAHIEARKGGTDRLLQLLQRGHVLHYAGRFDESNATFQQAEDLAGSLYTRSISQAAASLIVNDLAVDYRGKPHELAMVPFYRAFNYLSLGDPRRRPGRGAQGDPGAGGRGRGDAARDEPSGGPGGRPAAPGQRLPALVRGPAVRVGGGGQRCLRRLPQCRPRLPRGRRADRYCAAGSARPRPRAGRPRLRLLERGRRAARCLTRALPAGGRTLRTPGPAARSCSCSSRAGWRPATR